MLAVIRAEHFVIYFAIQKCENQFMQKGNFARHFVWACILVSHTWVRTQAEVFRE
jgi:hypothetical protein